MIERAVDFIRGLSKNTVTNLVFTSSFPRMASLIGSELLSFEYMPRSKLFLSMFIFIFNLDSVFEKRSFSQRVYGEQQKIHGNKN